MTDWKETTKKFFLAGSKIVFLLGFLILIYGATVYVLENTSLEVSKNILDYLRVIVWPIVTLIGLALFKDNVAEFIDRIEEGEMPGGVKVKAPHQELSLQSDKGIVQSSSEPSSDQLDIIVKEKEVAINSLKNSQEFLVDRLARAEIDLDFERIYNLIFSSQIELLSKLLTLSPVEFSYVEEHYRILRRTYKKAYRDWDVATYIKFLLNQKLIDIDEVARISITDKGRAFVSYLSIMNYRKLGI